MSESSAGNCSNLKILHYPDDGDPWPNPRSCIACGKKLNALDHTTDEAVLYHNPPADFIQCTSQAVQQELDLIIDVAADDVPSEVEVFPDTRPGLI
tara:strand:- start:27664 stop:27951 length:288 start_codon:yes stop_codon:yes gene_type:complete